MLRIPSDDVLQYLNDYFEYDFDTGKLWRFFPTPQEFRLIQGLNSEGYGRVYLKSKEYLAHHVCWYLYYGVWPKKELDHKNRVRYDNRINNLHEVTDAEQTSNLSTQSKFGNCVWFHKRLNKYEVTIRRNNTKTYLGLFKTAEEAIKARDIYLGAQNAQ